MMDCENKVVLFGCGDAGKRVFREYIGKNVLYFCDNDTNKVDNYIFDKRVISFGELVKLKQTDDNLIIVVSMDRLEYRFAVADQLLSANILDFIDISFFEDRSNNIESIADKEVRYRFVIDFVHSRWREIDYLKRHIDLQAMKPATGKLREYQIQLAEVASNVYQMIKNEIGITIWSDWGMLLGKCRHNGYIPWDDDIDFGIMRKDQKKLIDYFLLKDAAVYPQEINSTFNEMAGELLKRGSDYLLEIGPYATRIYGYDGEGSIKGIDIFVWDYFDEITNDTYLNIVQEIGQIDTDGKNTFEICEDIERVIESEAIIKKNEGEYVLPGVDVASGYGLGKLRFLLNSSDIFPVKEEEFEGVRLPFPQHKERVLDFEYGKWRKVPGDIGYNHSGKVTNF